MAALGPCCGVPTVTHQRCELRREETRPIQSFALKDDNCCVRAAAAGALEKLGWRPGQDEIGVAYWIGKGEWDKCVELGALAVEPLVAAIKNWRDHDERKAAAGRAIDQIGVRLNDDALRLRAIGIINAAHKARADFLLPRKPRRRHVDPDQNP